LLEQRPDDVIRKTIQEEEEEEEEIKQIGILGLGFNSDNDVAGKQFYLFCAGLT
jgi:hypothetical protein